MSITRRKIPRWVIAFALVWNLVGLAILVPMLISGNSLWVTLSFVVPAVVMVVIFVRSRRRVASEVASTDSIVNELTPGPNVSGDPDAAWSGGGSFPGWMGTMEASPPLAVLELFGDVVRLRVRPGFLGSVFGMLPLVASPSGVAEVFPVVRMFRRGVGFRTLDGSWYHFWTAQADTILIVLSDRQFPVTWQEQKYNWRN